MSLDAPERRCTPPDLKWLLNQRAANAGAQQRVVMRIRSLEQKLARVEAQVVRVRASLASARNSEASGRRGLQALDSVLASLYPQVEPTLVAPVGAWAGRYGERGALKQFVSAFVRAAAPHPVTASALTDAAQHQFGLSARAKEDRIQLRNSIRTALRALDGRDGLIERVSDMQPEAAKGLWRWKEPIPTLEQLRASVVEPGDDQAEDGPSGEVGHQ